MPRLRPTDKVTFITPPPGETHPSMELESDFPGDDMVLDADWDESKHPRDPHGRWTEGGGGEASGTESRRTLIGTGINREKLEGWKKQLEAQNAALPHEKFGTGEEDNLIQMIGAINERLGTTDEERWDYRKNFVEIHDLDDNLLAATEFSFNPRTKVATLEFVGGFDKDAKVKALQHAILAYRSSVDKASEHDLAEKIEAIAWENDDSGRAEALLAAGFRKEGDVVGGLQTFAIGSEGETKAMKEIREREKAEKVAKITATAMDVAKKLLVDPDKIHIVNESPTFELNGKVFNEAGHYMPGTDFVVLDLPNLTPESTAGITAHEIEHLKYHTWFDAQAKESIKVRDVVRDLHSTETVMEPNGLLKPPYDKQFPLYQQRVRLLDHGHDALEFSDGVTDYSAEYWEAYAHAQPRGGSAITETLSEMARFSVKYGAGEIPGDRPKRAETASKEDWAKYVEGRKTWTELFEAVNDHWAKTHGSATS